MTPLAPPPRRAYTNPTYSLSQSQLQTQAAPTEPVSSTDESSPRHSLRRAVSSPLLSEGTNLMGLPRPRLSQDTPATRRQRSLLSTPSLHTIYNPMICFETVLMRLKREPIVPLLQRSPLASTPAVRHSQNIRSHPQRIRRSGSSLNLSPSCKNVVGCHRHLLHPGRGLQVTSIGYTPRVSWLYHLRLRENQVRSHISRCPHRPARLRLRMQL